MTFYMAVARRPLGQSASDVIRIGKQKQNRVDTSAGSAIRQPDGLTIGRDGWCGPESLLKSVLTMPGAAFDAQEMKR